MMNGYFVLIFSAVCLNLYWVIAENDKTVPITEPNLQIDASTEATTVEELETEPNPDDSPITETTPYDGEYGKRCNCRCGERNEPSRIVGGEETGVNAFPWVTRLSYVNQFYCGGSLINDRYVLTAAHCVKTFMWFMIKVTLGEHNRCNKTHRPETRYVIQTVPHNFSFSDFNDDIAMLKMNERVTITDTLKPVCLPHNDEQTYEGVIGTAAGWGSIEENKKQSCVLREVDLPILSNEDCKKAKYEPSMITREMMCAGFPEDGKKDTCQGDSGGPLTAERNDKRHELLGIVSWGIGCARAGYPGVYTRVTKYLYWIRHNSRAGCFCTD